MKLFNDESLELQMIIDIDQANLSPCPFCSSEDLVVVQLLAAGVHGGLFYVVSCGDCRASGPSKATQEMAAKWWNNRFESGQPGGMLPMEPNDYAES